MGPMVSPSRLRMWISLWSWSWQSFCIKSNLSSPGFLLVSLLSFCDLSEVLAAYLSQIHSEVHVF